MRKFQCCFCGRGIDKNRWEPLTLDIYGPEGPSKQVLWSHVDCLGQHLNKVPFFSLSDRIKNHHDWQKEQIENLEEGQLVEGGIAFIKDYGVAVEVSEGFYGLLHVSNISQQSIEDPNEIFNVGDLVRAIIIHIDRQKQRVSLSTSVLEETPGDMIIDSKKVFQDAKKMAKNYSRKNG